MKKLIPIAFALLLTYSCKKTESTSSSSSNNNVKTVGRSELYGGGCQVCSSPTAATVYTGLSDAAIASMPGYGFYSDPNYDKGYYAGYNDGVYWVNIYLQSNGCNAKTELQVTPQQGGVPMLIDPTKTAVPANYNITAVATVYTCSTTGVTISYVMCEAANSCGPYTLKLQYEYNNSYPGRTTAQTSFDSGRLQGFIDATTHLPFAGE